jgi:hypothetical protein
MDGADAIITSNPNQVTFQFPAGSRRDREGHPARQDHLKGGETVSLKGTVAGIVNSLLIRIFSHD